MSDLNALKSSLPIRQVFEQYSVDINRNGFAHCPFHPDRHPSLKVYDETNTWHCFSCGRGSDAIDFVMQMESVDFITAKRALFGDAPVSLPTQMRMPSEREREDKLFKKLLDKRNYWQDIKDREKPIYNESVINFSELYATACKKVTLLEAEMDELLARTNEDKKRKESELNAE